MPNLHLKTNLNRSHRERLLQVMVPASSAHVMGPRVTEAAAPTGYGTAASQSTALYTQPASAAASDHTTGTLSICAQNGL